MLARLEQQIPGTIALVMSDPDAEVVLDPTAGKQMPDLVGRRVTLDVVADARGVDLRMLSDSLVERAKKIDAAVGVVFPTVLAVENDAHQRRPLTGVAPCGSTDRFQLADEVVGSMLRLETLVVKADLVAH